MKSPIGGLLLFLAVAFTSCNFLDRPPLDQISGDNYFNTADQLSNFTINYYGTIFRGNDGWHAGVATYDDGTDNQAVPGSGNTGMFVEKKWSVPANGGIGFNAIRDVTKFIKTAEAKQKENKITGAKEDINHYIGEAYAIRAMLYYGKLKAYGDYPILTDEINIDADLASASKRMPRNEVARQILKDLDTAIALLKPVAPRNQRISQRVAQVWKSRVALYEGTFELYHRGSGRVPGDAKWPGKDKEWNKGKSFDQEAEVKYFLTIAMESAKIVGEQIALTTPNNHVMNPTEGVYSGWNPYYDMYATPDLSKYPEVLLWREMNVSVGVAHKTSNKLRTGSQTGWSRSLVESFLMQNGLPIYNSASGYPGDTSIDLAKSGRDERLQLFVFGESDMLSVEKGNVLNFDHPYILSVGETKDGTGYRQRKFYNYDPAMQDGRTSTDICGQIYVRVEEAYLNYIEASYLLNNSIDGTARKYWEALRKRANITASIETTIAATDMAYEADVTRPSYDWGAFSAGTAVDPTLYSIRRERRCEFAGEGYRMDDLKRWRAMDQVKNYHIEGINIWDEKIKLDDPDYMMHHRIDDKFYKEDPTKTPEENKKANEHEKIISDGGETANVSSKELSKYFRPYQIRKNNELYNGMTFTQAYYLSPFSVQEMQLCSPTQKAEDSYLYQNPDWPIYAGYAE